MKKITIRIKHMCCDRCIMAVTDVLKGLGLQVESVKLGEAIYTEPAMIGYKNHDSFVEKGLKEKGFEIIANKEEYLVEEVKVAIMEFVHDLPKLENKKISLIKYMEDKVNTNYRELRIAFSKHKNTTIEKYFILQKVEMIKQLIDEGNLNFTEIADCMGYKATQHLAAQFKRVTGLTMNQYKNDKGKNRKGIDQI